MNERPQQGGSMVIGKRERAALSKLGAMCALLLGAGAACSTGPPAMVADEVLPLAVRELDPVRAGEGERDAVGAALRDQNFRGIALSVPPRAAANSGGAIPALGFRIADDPAEATAAPFDPASVVVVVSESGRLSATPLFERKHPPANQGAGAGTKSARKAATTVLQFDLDVASRAGRLANTAQTLITTVLHFDQRSNRGVTLLRGESASGVQAAAAGAAPLELARARVPASAPSCEIATGALEPEANHSLLVLGSREPGPWVLRLPPAAVEEGSFDPCALPEMPRLPQRYALWLFSGASLRGPALLELSAVR